MLATRIIPTLLCRGRQLVKGKQFNSWRTVGHAEQAVRIHQQRNVDELMLLDISATVEGRDPDYAMIEELSECCFMPLAVGGGVRTLEHVRGLLNAGADKVVMNTAAMENPQALREITDAVGSQAVVVSIDVLDGVVYSRSGAVRTGIPYRTAVLQAEDYGAGEILITSIEREGTLQGYDLQLVRDVATLVGIPVIANGGCGTYEHMHQAILAGADAVAAGAMFQFEDTTPQGAARYLSQHQVEVRL